MGVYFQAQGGKKSAGKGDYPESIPFQSWAQENELCCRTRPLKRRQEDEILG